MVSCVGDDIRRTRATVGRSSGDSMSSTAVLGVVFSKWASAAVFLGPAGIIGAGTCLGSGLGVSNASDSSASDAAE